MTNVQHYSYRVQWSQEDDMNVGLVSEFPSLSWLASSPVEALRGIERLVAEVVEDMAASGEVVPQPFSERDFSGKFMVRTSPQVHRDLTRTAAEMGISLNKLVGERLASA